MRRGLGHCLKVTRSFWARPFNSHDHPDLPRTNNALKEVLMRLHEKRLGRALGEAECATPAPEAGLARPCATARRDDGSRLDDVELQARMARDLGSPCPISVRNRKGRTQASAG
jgi:hypothetical protein